MSGCTHFDYQPRDKALLDSFGLGAPAFEYQSMGYAVLPLVRGGKKPHRMLPEEGGVHHATLDGMQAATWWQQDPAANIGVATGQKSRLVVIDLDVKGEHNGVDSFLEFVQAGSLELGYGPFARTPSGGRHLWFRTPEGASVPERPGILPGVDVKGDGGLVVAPPSMKLVHASGGHGDPSGTAEIPVPYEWAAGCPCSAPNAPPWLLPWLASVPERVASDGGSSAGGLDLAELKKTGIPAGERNQQFYKLACQLYRRAGVHAGASLQVLEALKEVWDASDKTGFTWSEMLTIIQSARRFITRQIETGDPRRMEQLRATGALDWARRVSGG